MGRRPSYDLMFAEFSSADGALAAVNGLRARGIRGLELYSPFDVPGAGGRLDLPRSRLPALVLVCGGIGAILSYLIQWFVDAWDYPLDVGGRPAHAVAAFIPATFEGTVLAAAVAAFLGWILVLRLPTLWHPAFEIDGFERATIDRFWISVDVLQSNRRLDDLVSVLVEQEPVRIVRCQNGRQPHQESGSE